MKKLVLLLLVAGTLASLTACGGDFRQRAQGAPSEILVLMETENHEGEMAEALRDVYGEFMLTMPRPEPRYDLRFTNIRTQNELQNAQKHRNLMIVAPIDEDSNVGAYLRSLLSEEVKSRVREGSLYEIPLRDRWYRDQWILILTGPDEESIERRIRNNSRAHLRSLSEVEQARWTYEVYRRGEVTAIADSLWENHGFRFRVQHDYVMGVDTTDFVSMRRFLEDNDRWIWVWYKDGVPDMDFISERWIHQTRDSLLNIYVRGTREDAYVRTDFRQDHRTELTRIGDLEAYESRGVWVMSDFSMGGPFINYTIHDPEQQRLYLLEFAQFSPRYRQRPFLYQFEAIARTFETNPDYDISASNQENQ